MMKTASKATFVKGPALTPVDALVRWLDDQKRGSEPRLVRVPLVVPAGQVGFDIGKSKIGELEVYANDSALGDGLADQAAMACEGQPSCAFLVEGYWRGKQAQGYRFDVVKARALDGDQAFAEVEGESGN